jgi:hypothetical protein
MVLQSITLSGKGNLDINAISIDMTLADAVNINIERINIFDLNEESFLTRSEKAF